METDMKNTMKRIALGIVLIVLPALADTPFQQALELQQDIQNVMEAFHDANADIQTLAEAPSKIRSTTRIGDMLDGIYKGPAPIVINSTSFSNTGFQNLNGAFDIYAPNLTAVANYMFDPSPGLQTFYGPKVTTVGTESFEGSSNLRIANLPSCTYFSGYAFNGCTSLTNIIAPKVTSTGEATFKNCTRLAKVDMPMLASPGTYAFNGCTALKEVNCQPLATVNNYAFTGCTSLTNVPIKKSSATFNTRCFNGCTSLDIKEDQWPDSISLSGGCQFYNCKSLKSINPFLEKFTQLLANADGDQGRYFQGCSGLTDIHSDNLVTLAAHGIFCDCNSVTNVDLPNVVQFGFGFDGTTAGYLFNGISSLKRVNLPKLQGINIQSTSGYCDNMFAYCTSLEEIEFPSLQTIGNSGATSIHEQGEPRNMFYHCYRLRSVRFPALEFLNIYSDSQEQAMFYLCYDLVDVQMPALKILRKKSYYDNSHTSVFAGCTKLAEVNFPSLEQIQRKARRMFYNCPSLRRVSMPKLVHMNNNAQNDTGTPGMTEMFYLCPYITDVTFGLKGEALKNYAGFPGGAPTTCVFHCPADAPFNVDVMYLTNAWTVVTNGTFQLCESIKGTGTQYINTGYVHKTNTVVEVEFAVGPEDSPNRWEYVFGSRSDDNTANSYGMFSYVDNARRWGYQRNSRIAGPAYPLDAETDFKAICASNQCAIYNAAGELLYTMTASGIPNHGVGPLAIFTCNQTATIGAFSPNQWKSKNMKLYRFTIKEEDETVMDLVPALVGGTNTEQVACLVDLKNNFHPIFNAGTGNFEAGSVTNDIATAYGLQE